MIDLKNFSKPKEFWKYFQEILKIPRCTGNEEEIREFIKEKSKSFGYKTQIDETGNLLASPKLERKNGEKIVILQSHLDMVCEKNKDITHDFSKDPIDIKIIKEEGEKWLTAKGTTLGADNGVGIAYSLALLETIGKIKKSSDFPIVKFLFTVEEEKGLTGAFNMDPSFLDADYLINLDSEEDDRFTIGCAGGTKTTGKINLNYLNFDELFQRLDSIHLSIKGLKGGHSGADIHKGRGNAIKILSKMLWKVNEEYSIHLSFLRGGNLPNAIPREAETTFFCEKNDTSQISDSLKQIKSEIELGISKIEPNMEIEIDKIKADNESKIFSKQITDKLLHLLYVMPNGPISYHPKNRDLVYTSTNLASIKIDSDILEIITSQRSLHKISKKIIQEKIVALFKLSDLEMDIECTGDYPGWVPNFDSELLKIAKESYLKVFNHEPHVQTIHAGLETGILKQKVSEIEMISLGPKVEHAHSPDERLKIASVEKIWKLLIALLQNIKNS